MTTSRPRALFLNDTPCGPFFTRMGWARVLQALGWDVLFWNPQTRPALDVFAELAPDLYLGQTYNLDRAQIKALSRSPQTRVVLYASAWGGLVDNIDRAKYPIVLVNDGEKRAIATLKDLTGKPDLVHLHLADRYVEGVLGGWRELGCQPVGLMNAADTFVYGGGQSRKEYQCDVAFVGGRWPFKARNLDRYLLPLCHPRSGVHVRIYGNQPWPVPSYLGHVEEEEVKHIFASALICPNVSEPHSTDLALGYDVVERIFKVPVAGGLCISDHVQSLVRDVFPEGEVPTGRTPQEFHDLIRHYLAHPDERWLLMARQKDRVIREHTYFHRVEKMFTALGMNDWAKMTRSAYNHTVLQPYLREIGQ